MGARHSVTIEVPGDADEVFGHSFLARKPD